MKASGENLSDIIINCLLEWNVDKICTITMDNASTNDVVARCLQEHYSFRSALLVNRSNIQVRYWGHVLNLIVQEGLDEINDCIHRVRNAVKYIRGSAKRKLEFLYYADQESNVFFREIYRVFMLLRKTSIEDSPLLGSMAVNMLVKFEKYWLEKEPNILLSVAFVLDPRFKMKKLKTIFNKIYESYLAPYMLDRIQKTLQDLFIEYVKAYEVNCQQDITSQNEKTIGTSSNISSTAKKNYMDDFYSLDKEEDSTCSKTELDSYLEKKIYPSKADEEESFNVLDYWRTHAAKFPILSMMARDILAIPVSSVASESAFSTGGRVLNKFRSSLLPFTVEALNCAQDWIKDIPKEIDFEQEFDPNFTG
ncbi:zinc finger BED domain-containing protein RICESLEEPER 2-like [Coffea arabica]|uniref:Zinc finger BED domain-containing protein RICESLEEPER 2-like n=1 Tax=Coffea arabica TaxID=13443 RepID=A0ABM4UQV3_COFAR